MKNQNKNISAISNKPIEMKDPMLHFKKKVLRHSALASNNISNLTFDIDDAMNQSQLMIQALKAQDGLQEMVAAQIISLHRLQQLSMSLANATDEMHHKQYFTNAAVKLANCFTQQANLLSRLQGNGGQRITIERVDVHHGGQAIVGNINEGVGR